MKAAAEEAGESWEDKADMSSAATTPDDEDNSMEDDSGETFKPKLSRYDIRWQLIDALSSSNHHPDDEDEKGFWL